MTTTRPDWAIETPERRQLAALLDDIARLDPSRPGADVPSDEVARYGQRNTQIIRAVAVAQAAGLIAGFGYDLEAPAPYRVVAYLHLPTGQVSWHMPSYPLGFDGHTIEQKYRRTGRYSHALGVGNGQP